MSAVSSLPIILDLNSIDELFNAPSLNPFSTHEVDIIGEAGIDRLIKKAVQPWPYRQLPVNVLLQLPAEKLKTDLQQQTRDAVQRYCSAKIAANRQKRHIDFQISWRELLMALVITFFAMLITALLVISPLDRLPAFTRIIIATVAALTAAVAIYDSIYAILLDWIPYTQEVRAYRRISELEITIEARAEPVDAAAVY